jgi:hypothetical protein
VQARLADATRPRLRGLVMSLQPQKAELERLGFRVLSATDDMVVATRTHFHWDCFFTFVSYHVVVRRVPVLTAETIVKDRKAHMREARKHDRNLLPRGIHKSRALILAYVAGRSMPQARQLCETPSRAHLAATFMPAVLDLGAQHAWYFRDLRLWGAVCIPKLRYLVQRLLEPQLEPAERLPLSRSGLALTAASLLFLVLLLARLPSALGWRILPIFASKVPDIVAANNLVAGGAAFCVTQADQTLCWSSGPAASPQRPTPVAGLSRARSVAMRPSDACALDDAGVKCWSLDKPMAVLQEGTQGATDLIATDNNYCALVGEQVRCWREPGAPSEGMVALRRPRRLIASLFRPAFCALDDAGLKCFHYFAQETPPYYQPTFFAVGVVDPVAVSAVDFANRIVVLEPGKLSSYFEPVALPAGPGNVRRKRGFELPVTLKPMAGFRNPRALIEDSVFTYALDDEGVKRVDPGGKQDETELSLPGGARVRSDRGGPANARLLAGPVAPSAIWSGPGGYVYSRDEQDGALLRASGLRRGKPDSFVVHGVRDPKKVVRGLYETCALDGSGVKCWPSPSEPVN